MPIAPGGMVADYVPFYFAPRSPMLFAIDRGNVPTYQQGCAEIVYLVSNTQELRERGLSVLGTDRNATMAYAEFTSDDDHLTDIVDWDLMKARIWRKTVDEPDRMERRQAELLVHEQMPWSAIMEVATKSEEVKSRVEAALSRLGQSTPVAVRPGWYF